MNLFNLNKPIQFFINWKSQQFYLHTRNYLILFEYAQNQTDYSIHNLNSTQQNQEQFLTICEKTNHIEFLSMNYSNKKQVCLQTCQYLPITFNDKNRIHTIQRLSSLSGILYCSKQRRITKIVLIILIVTDLAMIFVYISWLGYKYFYQSTLGKHKRQANSGTVWIVDNDLITYF